MLFLRNIFFITAVVLVGSCKTNDNVIQGLVSYFDHTANLTIPAEGTAVYLYGSIVDQQDHPLSFLKKTIVGGSGYYYFSSLSSGPYYVYAEKLDSSGVILYFDGKSTDVSGNQTKIVDLPLH